MAAAYAALVSLLNNLEDMQNHPRHSFSLDNNQIQSLVKSVTFLIEFMESYDNSPSCPSKDASQLLERRITCAAQAAEEVFESHIVNQIRGGSTLDGKTRSPRFLLDVEKVNQDMDYVMRKAIKIQQAQRDGVKPKQPTYSAPASSSTQLLTSEKTTMVGFDDLLIQLLDVLTGHLTSRRVIPIVGTGGVGKTTLAKNAFDHKLIMQHFDVCLWATISQQYDVRDILLTLLSPQERSGSETVGELSEKLHKKLYGRTYLVVLDDIWSVTVWDEMLSWFPDTNNRSRIIVTTRQSDVVDYIGSPRLAISLLDDDKGWDLFCQKAFAGEGCPAELEDVGKNIVRKCKGLPLAIVVVAGHLAKSSQTRESWENVASNMMSILNSAENHLLDILSFSYSHLPVHLKPCFVYMGTFQEDEEIYVSDLINHWIAEGFLKPCKANNLEKIARDYLKDLIDRNLILDCTRNSTVCKIHDLLRELCLEVAKKEMFFYMANHGQAICRERRVGIKGKNREENRHPAEISHATPLVRSIRWDIVEESLDLRLCRILKGNEKVSNEEVDGGFVEANLQYVNLRYLEYGTCLPNARDVVHLPSFLPSSISLFWNLQTLIIDEGLYTTFDEFWEMIQLRHLEVNNRIQLPDPPPSDQRRGLVMRNLHTLKVVENLKFSEEFCKRVPNVKELEARYYSNELELEARYNSYELELEARYNSNEGISYCCPHNLGCLSNLESLTLCMLQDEDSTCRKFSLSLTFPSSLKKLYLIDSYLGWEEMTMMVGSLPHLETLYFEGKNGSEWTLVEGKFLRLKSLNIWSRDLVKWNVDNSHFPVLEHLILDDMFRLNELPSDIGAIPTLRYITLKFSTICSECNVSLAISAMRMLVEQEEYGNEGLTLDVIFFGDGSELKSFNKILEEEGLASNNLRLFG